MRIAFMGTPQFAVPTLERLVADGHEVAAVYTQPPRPAGRGKALTPSPVERSARELGLEVRCPERLKDEAEAFAALDLDAAVVAAYGLILPRGILASPRSGCLNVHASLLPRWRGAAPVQRAILAGDAETGVTIMDMEAGLDTGPMRLATSVEIGSKTAGQLTHELAHLGAAMMSDVLAETDRYPPFAQPAEGVTHAAKIDKAEARLDFSKSSELVARQVRAFDPAPGAYFESRGERIKVLEAMEARAEGDVPGAVLDDRLLVACWAGSIRPTLLQRAGRAAMSVDDFLRGFPITAGTRLG